MALDSASAAFMDQVNASGAPPLHEMTPEQARELGAGFAAMFGEGPDMERVEDFRVPTTDGDFRVRLLVPGGSPRGLVLYFHGGGWVTGVIEEFETLGRQIAERTECNVLMVEYRLAPEHPYPAAVEDTLAAVQWAHDRLGDLAAPGVPLIVMGDSAGGGLAAVACQHFAGSEVAISQQVLVYPVTDSDFTSPSYLDTDNQLLLQTRTMQWYFDHYTPDPAVRSNVDISPLRATDLTGLPPAVVLTAEHDVLRHEGEAYAERLREAGVPVTSQCLEGQIHGFFTMVGLLPGAQSGQDVVVAAVRAHLDEVAGAAPVRA